MFARGASIIVAMMAGGPAAADCPTTGSESATVAGIEDRQEVRLADGRLIRLVGLDPVSQTPTTPDRADLAREDLAKRVVGHDIGLQVLSDHPDRWGRLPAFAFDGGEAGGLAAWLIALGFGRYRAEPAAHACREAFLAAEAAARSAKLGLWADPYYGVLAVDDREAFTERAGTDVIAEAQLESIDRGPFRTKLRFAAKRSTEHTSYGRRLTVSILPKVVKAFEAQGVSLNGLIGSTLRVRGLLDLRFGPEIELSGPDALEVVTPALAPVSTLSKTP